MPEQLNFKIKLNLGCGNKKLEDGWMGIDIQNFEAIDATCDLASTPFKLKIQNWDKFKDWNIDKEIKMGELPLIFSNNMVDEIIMEEVLEHISFRKTDAVLHELNRILKPGGKLTIQVPDCGAAMTAWYEGKVCNCVPHKPKGDDPFVAFKGDPACPKCQGRAIMDFQRFMFSFTGAQKHDWDIHRAIFTKDILSDKLRIAGFNNIEFIPHPVKLRVKIIK